MLKCMCWNHKQSTKVLSARFQAFHHYDRFNHSYAQFNSRFAPKSKHSSAFTASNRCIRTTGISSNSTLTQERSKYESNALPKEAKVVVCGGGVIGGKYLYPTHLIVVFSLHKI